MRTLTFEELAELEADFADDWFALIGLREIPERFRRAACAAVLQSVAAQIKVDEIVEAMLVEASAYSSAAHEVSVRDQPPWSAGGFWGPADENGPEDELEEPEPRFEPDPAQRYARHWFLVWERNGALEGGSWLGPSQSERLRALRRAKERFES